jgi:hypothetical protein
VAHVDALFACVIAHQSSQAFLRCRKWRQLFKSTRTVMQTRKHHVSQNSESASGGCFLPYFPTFTASSDS